MMSLTANDRISRWTSRAMYVVCVGFAVAILAVLALVTVYLFAKGVAWLSPQFFTMSPVMDGTDPKFPGGMLNGIVGTLILIAMACAVGIPVGLLAGVHLAEYDVGSWVATPVRFVADVLSGVPSIVVGILGYELLVRPFGRYNAWAGALALAFIMIPLVARTTEEMLRLVPASYREASIALGATKARTILGVVFPAAKGSVLTGVMLAIARIAGETAPLLFTVVGYGYFTLNLNDKFPSLTKQIYDNLDKPSPQEQGTAWAGILVLIGIIFAINLSLRFLIRNKRGQARA
jgi:phosphate transport system permease protein